MSMIDLNNLDKLSPQQREQFNSLLTQFPHLEPKLKQSRELNTPSKQELVSQGLVDENEIDYADFLTPSVEPAKREISKKDIPKMRIDPAGKNSFMNSFNEDGQEEDEDKPKEKKKDYEKKRRKEERREEGEFSIEGKPHPILAKLRATVGLGRKDIATLNLAGSTYSIKALDRKSITQATSFATIYAGDPILYSTAIEESIVAHSIHSIDGVPIADIFDIPKMKKENNKMVPMLQYERESEAAKKMFFEIRSLPNEIVESLSVFYQQEFPPLQLMEKNKSRFLCPEANCMQSRIELITETCYCPKHGSQMVRETELPNPS